MAAVPHSLLTLEEFDRLYGAEAGWEYWFGEAVKKPVPTWSHGILQIVLANLLFESGYYAGAEIDLKSTHNGSRGRTCWQQPSLKAEIPQNQSILWSRSCPMISFGTSTTNAVITYGSESQPFS